MIPYSSCFVHESSWWCCSACFCRDGICKRADWTFLTLLHALCAALRSNYYSCVKFILPVCLQTFLECMLDSAVLIRHLHDQNRTFSICWRKLASCVCYILGDDIPCPFLKVCSIWHCLFLLSSILSDIWYT